MINAAIYGIGRWGETLLRSVAGGSEKIRFSTGIIRDLESHRALADDVGIALSDDYAAVLADPAIDAVVLATPPFVHGAQIAEAARAGKHVFVEKPRSRPQRPVPQRMPAGRRACVWRSGTIAGFFPRWSIWSS